MAPFCEKTGSEYLDVVQLVINGLKMSLYSENSRFNNGSIDVVSTKYGFYVVGKMLIYTAAAIQRLWRSGA